MRKLVKDADINEWDVRSDFMEIHEAIQFLYSAEANGATHAYFDIIDLRCVAIKAHEQTDAEFEAEALENDLRRLNANKRADNTNAIDEDLPF